jgi:hypothetical protein
MRLLTKTSIENPLRLRRLKAIQSLRRLPVNAQGFIDHPKQKPEDEDGDERQVLPEPRKPF